jgi:copper transport protein
VTRAPHRRGLHARALACAALALACSALLPATASAHAVLESSQPARGERLEEPPQRVTLRFDEPVDLAFGSVRVFDARGQRVDRGSAGHPGGRGELISVDLRPNLPDGAYTATYRVVSADSHPIAGGFVFTVGQGGAAPAQTVDELLAGGSAGPATEVAFGVVRGLGYLAIALCAGGLAFVAAVWLPARPPAEADSAFAGRWRVLAVGGALAGIVTSALGIVLQGATAAGESLWSALDPAVIEAVLGTRFGTVWAIRLGAFAVLALALARRPPAFTVAAALAALVCVTPGLSGHASTADPAALVLPANALHVGAMAVWVGGVAMLLLAVPGATRRLEPPQRTPLLAAVVARFSTLALAAVGALLASGVLQSIAELHAVADLWDSAFGRAILVKAALMAGLIAIGAWNRGRGRPLLARRAAAGEPPGRTGFLLRRALRAELALMLAVLGATAALASYAPPSAATGPFAGTATLGPIRVELTLDPAAAGANELHLYLSRRRDGGPFDGVKELRLTVSLPDRDIGPLDLRPHQAGPGHWVVRGAHLAPAGEWQLDVLARVSEFDAYSAEVEVPLR